MQETAPVRCSAVAVAVAVAIAVVWCGVGKRKVWMPPLSTWRRRRRRSNGGAEGQRDWREKGAATIFLRNQAVLGRAWFSCSTSGSIRQHPAANIWPPSPAAQSSALPQPKEGQCHSSRIILCGKSRQDKKDKHDKTLWSNVPRRPFRELLDLQMGINPFPYWLITNKYSTVFQNHIWTLYTLYAWLPGYLVSAFAYRLL